MSAALQSLTFNEDFGSATAMTGIYQVILSKTSYPDPVVALATAKTDSDIPAFGERASNTVDMYATTRQTQLQPDRVGNLNWIINVQVDFKPGHLVGNNYVLTTRASLQSVTSSRDYQGNLLVVNYTPTGGSAQDPQTGEIQILYPQVDIQCSGVSETNDPKATIGAWIGYCNSAPCWGYKTYELLCTGASFEPVSLTASPNKYKFDFQFQCSPSLPGTMALSGWEQFIYWRDGNGRVPTDADPTNGISAVLPYPSIDYLSTFPLAKVLS